MAMRALLAAGLLLAWPPGAGVASAAGDHLTVIELFTSQGCSSCPPADSLLTELSRADTGLLPLDLHVTYWDRLGWKDPFSLTAATNRQRHYGTQMGLDSIYTPQMIVDGHYQAIGSDRDAVMKVIAQARTAPAWVAVSVVPGAGGLRVRVASGSGRGMLLLVGFDREHATPVRAGENGGRTLTEVNVVRSIGVAGAWSGAAIDTVLPRTEGERAAVLLQADDGRILGAAVTP